MGERAARGRLRAWYGAPLRHLLLLVGAFTLLGYTVYRLGWAGLWNSDRWWGSIAVWLVGAFVVHDLVLFPLYAAVDRALVALLAREKTVQPLNYVRLPLLACALVTLMFWPGVVRQGEGTYRAATGQTQEPFLGRWLLLCGAFLLTGAVLYMLRVAVQRRRRR